MKLQPLAQPQAMKHETRPEWGTGLVVQDLPQHWVLFFEHAGERKFVKQMAKVLVPVTLPAAELARLSARASGRRPKPPPSPTARPKVAKARFETFAQQLAAFEALFPGGFRGERFVTDERGAEGATGKAGKRQAGVTIAQERLSPKAFAAAAPGGIFETARKLLQTTGLVLSIEGTSLFAALDAEGQAQFTQELEQLLHGEGEYGQRLQRFASQVHLKDKRGHAKPMSWPLATAFGGLYEPGALTCVRPATFATQAVTLGLSAEKGQPVSRVGYRTFSEVATRTRELLVAAGQEPRDLLDVYSFITRTHADKRVS
jgi:hypothetical protein